MNFSKLYSMQKQLDSYIEANHNLNNDNLVEKKILALLVEIGELANETRCFKFWSVKPPAANDKILEEFVDGTHFILSLGLELGFEKKEVKIKNNLSLGIIEQFLRVFECVSKLKQSYDFDDFENLFSEYVSLGESLGFSQQEVEQAYIQKNEVNYKRQENGY
ncbi:MAG TPA: dUTP diphosphatase [Pseudoneobacillus sp.]|nr:dUTP diphosphatase [Pseudoneobacillus sp.]